MAKVPTVPRLRMPGYTPTPKKLLRGPPGFTPLRPRPVKVGGYTPTPRGLLRGPPGYSPTPPKLLRGPPGFSPTPEWLKGRRLDVQPKLPKPGFDELKFLEQLRTHEGGVPMGAEQEERLRELGASMDEIEDVRARYRTPYTRKSWYPPFSSDQSLGGPPEVPLAVDYKEARTNPNLRAIADKLGFTMGIPMAELGMLRARTQSQSLNRLGLQSDTGQGEGNRSRVLGELQERVIREMPRRDRTRIDQLLDMETPEARREAEAIVDYWIDVASKEFAKKYGPIPSRHSSLWSAKPEATVQSEARIRQLLGGGGKYSGN